MMWMCRNCGESLEDTFNACWKCKRARDGEALEDAAPRQELRCVRCDEALTFSGTKAFHEGTRLGFLGEIGELFVNREKLDVYHCPRCGRVEFFVDGVGEELRPS